jgi:hypothetical protein
MRHRIILLILFVLISALSVVSQTRTNQTIDNLSPAKLKQKYSSINEKGQYKIRPRIGLTAKFKESGQPLEMRIEPLDSSEEKSAKTKSLDIMPSEEAAEVLNELVPEAKRGKKGTVVDTVSGCLIDSSTLYELVAINIAKRCEEGGGGTYSISITWKQR